jgi:iron complex transport system substrate-binding protein
MRLWNHAALRVLDVRHTTLQAGESFRAYQLPASVFLFTSRGRARVLLDDREYAADKCLICHAGKGTFLDIVQVIEPFEYYMVFYKAVMTLPFRQELVRSFEASNPFQVQYGFVPQHQLSLFIRLEQMNKLWQQPGLLEKFHVKALFHQLVHDLLQQLYVQGGEATEPDLVAQAVRFIEEHYAEPITLDSLEADLDTSARQLQRLFKANLQKGPMEYLIQVRIDKAKAMLQHMDVSLKEIAEAVGYADSYYFSRIFKKYTGVSPSLFKEKSLQMDTRRYNPSRMSRLSIVEDRLRRYISKGDDDNHYQYRDRGAIPMYKSSKAALVMSMMLSITLLLGACSGTTGTNAGGAASATNSVNAQPSATSAEAGNTQAPEATKVSATRTIKHMKGEYVLEQTPKNIALLDPQFMDQLLALGEQPTSSVITSADDEKFPEYLMDKLDKQDDVKVLGTKDEPNLEAIIGASPDLIICTEFQEKIYDELVKIAPTIMLERNEDWRTTILTFGQIVDKEEEAQKVVDSYNQKISDLKATLAVKMGGQTVALVRPRDNIIRLHTTAHRTAEILYNDLGLAAPQMAQDSANTSSALSLEVMPELNADHLFVLKDDSNTDLTDEFQKTTIWKGLSAVKADQVYTVNTTMWIGYYGPLAINLVVDEIAEALL